MKLRIVSGILAAILLGFSWAQSPTQAAGVTWGTTAYANFAWDTPTIPADGVGDSPLVP